MAQREIVYKQMGRSNYNLSREQFPVEGYVKKIILDSEEFSRESREHSKNPGRAFLPKIRIYLIDKLTLVDEIVIYANIEFYAETIKIQDLTNKLQPGRLIKFQRVTRKITKSLNLLFKTTLYTDLRDPQVSPSMVYQIERNFRRRLRDSELDYPRYLEPIALRTYQHNLINRNVVKIVCRIEELIF
jgi:hypothetical protein